MKSDVTVESNKSTGKDGILIELFHATETEATEILTRICQLIWKINVFSRLKMFNIASNP